MKSGIALAALLASAAALGGCAQGPDGPPTPKAEEAPAPIGKSDINPNRAAGAIETPSKELPSLKDMKATRAPKKSDSENPEDRLRLPALREAALAYGVRGGLAWASREINRTLKSRARDLDRIFDFGPLMLAGPDNASVRPPVISEALDTYEIEKDGKYLRVAEEAYEIIEKARFAPTAPIWQGYLIRNYEAPEKPADALMPENEREVEIWRKAVEKGWKKGREQAVQIFRADLSRLEKAFRGMVRYRRLLAQGMVDAPVMAAGRMGVTGGGDEMRVNDRALRITKGSELIAEPEDWEARPGPRKRK